MPDEPRTPTVPDPAPSILSGEGPRHEVAGCPTGLSDLSEGTATPLEPLVGARPDSIVSPGEGVNEEQQKKSGQKD